MFCYFDYSCSFKGHCNGCINTGSFELRHPENNCLFIGGHMNGCLPFGGDSQSDSDDEDV